VILETLSTPKSHEVTSTRCSSVVLTRLTTARTSSSPFCQTLVAIAIATLTWSLDRETPCCPRISNSRAYRRWTDTPNRTQPTTIARPQAMVIQVHRRQTIVDPLPPLSFLRTPDQIQRPILNSHDEILHHRLREQHNRIRSYGAIRNHAEARPIYSRLHKHWLYATSLARGFISI
jgi:hypothetical protein